MTTNSPSNERLKPGKTFTSYEEYLQTLYPVASRQIPEEEEGDLAEFGTYLAQASFSRNLNLLR